MSGPLARAIGPTTLPFVIAPRVAYAQQTIAIVLFRCQNTYERGFVNTRVSHKGEIERDIGKALGGLGLGLRYEP